jgi:predicted secreted protein
MPRRATARNGLVAGPPRYNFGGFVGLKERLFGRSPPTDMRGRKVVALIECHLNQNARDAGAARSAAVNDALLEVLRAAQVGLLQIPCPEMFDLGLARERPQGTRIRDALRPGRCRELARQVADRIEEYASNDVAVLAVVGGDVESPGCAVHPAGEGLGPRSGVFMLELRNELEDRGLAIPFRGLRESDPAALEEDLRWLAARVDPDGSRPTE